MASRREQLEAYTFARRRLVAGFLQPEPAGGNEEKAPRAFRAILPGIVVGALILTGFGVYGLIKPGVPPGWKNKGSLIVGRNSASRYVYIDNQLHPVLNIASGRLLLEPSKFKVNMVPEKALNSVKHGAPLGIPNAPDRLPTAKEVTKAKSWTVCERPVAKDGKADLKGLPERSIFIGSADQERMLQSDTVLNEALFVQLHPDDHDKTKGEPPIYVVQNGHAYLIADKRVRTALALDAYQPQLVSRKFLDTFVPGSDIDFLNIGGYGTAVTYDIPAAMRTVGIVLKAEGTGQHYLVTKDSVVPVSRFLAALLVSHPDARKAYGQGRTPAVFPVALSDLGTNIKAGSMYAAEKGWPELLPQVVNRPEAPGGGNRATLCNTLDGGPGGSGAVTRVSARDDLPEELVVGMGGVWVRPGAGALIREYTGNADDKTGMLFLVTDSGLRYQILNEPEQPGGPLPQPGEDSIAKIRLGYKGVPPTPVPRTWAGLMPVGVPLGHNGARQPQTS